MTAEAIRPRLKGETTFVDGLIEFAVDTANQCLVPQGIPKFLVRPRPPASRACRGSGFSITFAWVASQLPVQAV